MGTLLTTILSGIMAAGCVAHQKDKVVAIINVPTIDVADRKDLSNVLMIKSNKYKLEFVDVSKKQSQLDGGFSSIYIGVYKLDKHNRIPILIASDGGQFNSTRIVVLDGPTKGYSAGMKIELVNELSQRWPGTTIQPAR
jgi:hypothetical protein